MWYRILIQKPRGDKDVNQPLRVTHAQLKEHVRCVQVPLRSPLGELQPGCVFLLNVGHSSPNRRLTRDTRAFFSLFSQFFSECWSCWGLFWYNWAHFSQQQELQWLASQRSAAFAFSLHLWSWSTRKRTRLAGASCLSEISPSSQVHCFHTAFPSSSPHTGKGAAGHSTSQWGACSGQVWGNAVSLRSPGQHLNLSSSAAKPGGLVCKG